MGKHIVFGRDSHALRDKIGGMRVRPTQTALSLKPFWQSAMIAAATAALVYGASHTVSFADFDEWTYDFTVVHAGLTPTASNIVFIDFDEETFARIQKFPIPRATIAEVVSRIGSQKPRVVGMDIFLSEPQTPQGDSAMQAALTSAGVVILASQTSGGKLPPVVPLATFCQPEDPGAASSFCVDGKPGALGYAFVNMPLDADGFIRQANLFFPDNPPSLSFPLVLAQQYTGQSIKPVNNDRASFLGHTFYFADSDFKTILIGSWARWPVTHISAWRILSGDLPSGELTDKLVIIGQSSDAARDRHFTPLFRAAAPDGSRLRMSGTAIQAAAVRTLLEGTTVRMAPRGWWWTVVLLVCWLTSLALLRFRMAIGLVCAAVLVVLSCCVALFLFAKVRLWMPFLPVQLGIVATLPITLGSQFLEERLLARKSHALRKQLMKLFSSYVDPVVAKTIWARRKEVSLIGELRTATILFTDIRNFTAMSSGKPPAEVLLWLNQYLTAMDEVIREHGGFLNKFIGDGLMIIFGLPLSYSVRDDAIRAMRASLAMLDRVLVLNRQNIANPDRQQLRIGIGIHTGALVAGSIGAATRQEYSVIGETVNLASRLEALNKQFKTEIIMSQATFDLVAEDFTGFLPLGKAKIAGFEDPVPVFTILRPETLQESREQTDKTATEESIP
jgi:adenylate cyclase